MSLDKYAKDRIEAVLDHLLDDDEQLLRAWVATTCAAEYARGEHNGKAKSEREVYRFAGVVSGVGAVLVLAFIAWAAAPEGWPLECPPVVECPSGPDPTTLSWYQPWGGAAPSVGKTDTLACVEWAGTFACVPIARSPETLPGGIAP